MVDDDIPSEIKLSPAQWVRLPGTGVEVMLRGKYRDNDPPVIVWWRHDPTTDTGYWDLTMVYPRLLVRGAEPGEQPTTLEEATRPPIRRKPRTPRRNDRPVTAAYPWRQR